MALIQCQFFSDTLGLSLTMNAIVPQPTKGGQIGIASPGKRKRYPVLYLLHGYSDDHSIWCRRTAIERYAAEYNLIIIMPSADHSFYSDMPGGHKYWTFISRELPELVSHFFPASSEREDTFVAGLSMGGYGAFKLALACPEKYAAAASLSGALDLREHWEADVPRHSDEFNLIFGGKEGFIHSDNDLLQLVDTLKASKKPTPKLYQACGTEDFLYSQNQSFKKHALGHGLAIDYFERPGAHSWDFWDVEIQKVLKWLPLNS